MEEAGFKSLARIKPDLSKYPVLVVFYLYILIKFSFFHGRSPKQSLHQNSLSRHSLILSLYVRGHRTYPTGPCRDKS